MDPKQSESSSEEKARVLPSIVQEGTSPDLVIAFGTANMPDEGTFNGCVTAGTQVFIHDSKASNPNPASRWSNAAFGKLLKTSDSIISADLLSKITRTFRSEIESRFISPPINAIKTPVIISSVSSVAISNVNITEYDDYVWADREALGRFKDVAPRSSAISVETTHGVIRLNVPSREFMFISGIANRLGYFNAEVSPRSYAQNFVAAHNAAVLTAWMIPHLV